MFLRNNITKTISPNVIHFRYINNAFPNLNSENVETELNLNSKNHYLKKKLNELVQWYEELTGLDEVKDMQNRVIAAQNRFAEAQEQRREVNKQLNKVNYKLKEISSELDISKRGETRYLQLITQEHEVMKEERRLNTDFALLERAERECFTLLSSCVKESHEKERAQMERTKYLSLIGSVVGTILGIAGSSINNYFKMREIRKLVNDTQLKIAPMPSDILKKHENEFSSILFDLKGIVNYFKKDEIDKKSQVEVSKILTYLGKEQERVNKHANELGTTLEKLKGILSRIQCNNAFEKLKDSPSGFEYFVMGISLAIMVPFIWSWLR